MDVVVERERALRPEASREDWLEWLDSHLEFKESNYDTRKTKEVVGGSRR